MSSGFTLEAREGYLYLQLEPGFEMNRESMIRFWTAVSDACREHGLSRVLAEGDNLQRRLTPMETFDLAGVASRLLPGLSVACCFRGYLPDEQSQFFKTAALNRGVRAEFFQDLSSALRWLGAANASPG